jgi:hypothetical protein
MRKRFEESSSSLNPNKTRQIEFALADKCFEWIINRCFRCHSVPGLKHRSCNTSGRFTKFIFRN